MRSLSMVLRLRLLRILCLLRHGRHCQSTTLLLVSAPSVAAAAVPSVAEYTVLVAPPSVPVGMKKWQARRPMLFLPPPCLLGEHR